MGSDHLKLRTVLLISGSGTTAEAILKAVERGVLAHVEVVHVISSNPNAGGIEKSRRLGVSTSVINPKEFPTPDMFGEALLSILRRLRADLVSQNGWLPKTPRNVTNYFNNRITNQHPGPLDTGRPDFGGKGMYGLRVHCARLAYAWLSGQRHPKTEACVHYVTENYDEGLLIRTESLAIPRAERKYTLDQLYASADILLERAKNIQEQLLPLEHNNVIETIKLFTLATQPRGFRRTKPLIPKEHYAMLTQVKQLAVTLLPHG